MQLLKGNLTIQLSESKFFIDFRSTTPTLAIHPTQASSQTSSFQAEEKVARGARPFASPLARKLAKKSNIDLSMIKGSGPRGRIMSRDLAGLTFSGSHYFGWQKTAEGPSIEEELEKALFSILHLHPVLQAASRTDRGVHALGQVVQFPLDQEIEPKKLLLGLNALLPHDIRVIKVTLQAETFHPTLDATGKEYRYHLMLGNTANPLHRHMARHVPKFHLTEDVLNAIPLLTGTRDFKAFCNFRKDLKYETTIRTLKSIELIEEGPLLTISLIGDHFLYKMARNIVGLLVQIGEGKFPISEVPALFEHGDRTKSAVTAPAHGLILYRVFY